MRIGPMSWKKKTALSVLALFALIFLFLVEEHFRGTWALARWKARMAAKEEPVTIPQAIVPKPSPRDNGMPALTGAVTQSIVVAGNRTSSFPPNLRPPAAAYAAQGK